jgi:Uma2 family endonuclease
LATTTVMSGAAFDQLPVEECRKWELLEGELIEVPMATPRHQRVLSILDFSFENYFRNKALGVVLPESEFALGDSNRLRPDLAILLSETWAKIDLDKSPIRLAPDIAIEILSPSERADQSLRKVWVYLGAGVQEVWQISLPNQKVLIYRSGSKSVSVLDPGDRLSTVLLPDWDIAVSELFER